MPFFQIIHEDSDLLVINKPADLACHPTKGDPLSSLVGRARIYLGPFARPQLINRLDRETSGIVLFAKTALAARELRRLWEIRQVQKQYLAIVHGWIDRSEGVIDVPLGPDKLSPVAIKNMVRSDGVPARTRFVVLRRLSRTEGKFCLLQVEPLTGRKHQIRIHLSHLGYPIVGDKLYGSDESLYLDFVKSRLTDSQKQLLILPHHALHAHSVRFTWCGRAWHFQADPEQPFQRFLLETEPVRG